MEQRRRTVDGRGLADIRLVQLEDGPGRGQRLFLARNAIGIGFEIAPDRGFDISALTWRGLNIGWNSANGMPWPPNRLDAEEGVGFYRNLDGFLVTCGLDHIGAASIDPADHYIHKHRKKVFHPLHGRISVQRASVVGYGIDWETDTPVIWAEATVRQSSVFGENLVLSRRIEADVFGSGIRITDRVENRGFRPTPHAILYHVNFGYPFLDQGIQISGDLDAEFSSHFNAEDKSPRDDFVDYFEKVPLMEGSETATIALSNPGFSQGTGVELKFSRQALPGFGIWRAFQSGVYALALEPMHGPEQVDNQNLQPGEGSSYRLEIAVTGMGR